MVCTPQGCVHIRCRRTCIAIESRACKWPWAGLVVPGEGEGCVRRRAQKGARWLVVLSQAST